MSTLVMHLGVLEKYTFIILGHKMIGNSGVGGACRRVEVRPGSLDVDLWPGGDIASNILAAL